MKRSFKQIGDELRLYWSNYVFQSLLATASMFIVLLLLSTHEVVIAASIGATSFIIFAMPKSITANAKNVIGGYVAGIFSGSLCALIPHEMLMLPSIAVYSLSVGLAMFIMVVTDTEHPPAGATALGVSIHGFNIGVAITTLGSVVILSLIHHYFKRYLRDLV